jgi:ABC-2 type transport system ATP-binding protein
MITLDNITKIFKTDAFAKDFTALQNVSFAIEEGKVTGFLGANGAGKTTSMKIMMDFIKPTQGKVKFDKSLGQRKIEIFKNIGFLPERPFFYPHLRGYEFIQFMGELAEVEKRVLNERVAYWGPRFKIDFALERKIKTYSKGMLQRVGFLATLIHDPKIIILDEPLSGLDPIGRKELKDVIIEVHKEGKTVFFSSHIVSDIEEVCENVIFLKDGKLEYDGKIDTLLKQHEKADCIIKVNTPEINLSTQVEEIQVSQGNFHQLKVARANKEQVIRELMEKNIDIVSLEQSKLSLEEVFYQGK